MIIFLFCAGSKRAIRSRKHLRQYRCGLQILGCKILLSIPIGTLFALTAFFGIGRLCEACIGRRSAGGHVERECTVPAY